MVETGIDFADALHLSKSAHCTGFATFDRNLAKAAKATGLKSVREA
jgi:predicted nucleic acid-binding protein